MNTIYILIIQMKKKKWTTSGNKYVYFFKTWF